MIGRPPAPAGVSPASRMGSRCQVRVGFFTLRSCGQPGAGACGGCGRSTCDSHLQRNMAPPLCVECAARQREQQGWQLDDLADDMSFYLYRQGFYQRVYGSSYGGPSFFDDGSDRAALDAANLAQGEAEDADADPAGALDS